MLTGSLSFTKLVIVSSAPAKSAGDATYASQDPFIQVFNRLEGAIGGD